MSPPITHYMTRAPYCATTDDNLERARALMKRHRIRHLPVVDGNELVGVLLDRELSVLESIPGVHASDVSVTRAMRPALSISENMPLEEAVDLMAEHGLDYVVVRDDTGAVEGIFTVVDAGRARPRAQ